MSNDASTIVQRLWNYCHVLRDDGVSYTDYVEQLTYLLFLKMADEQAQAGKTSPIDPQYSWSTLVRLEDSDELKRHYQAVLSQLGQGTGMIPTIFRKAQNRIQDPVKLYHLIRLIESKEWNTFDVDVKAEIYEGILERNAQDVKSGAGQYFTPRPLIRAIVDVIQPKSGQTICDPACGTGGFLTIAYDYILKHYELDNALLEHVRTKALHGWEIVENTARLCVMNLYLHGIGVDSENSPIRVQDSLISDPGDRFDVVLSNPPFGKRSSITYTIDAGRNKNKGQAVLRENFYVSTSNKQLSFLQHIKTILAESGQAAVVLPDNVLFEGGAGEIIRSELLKECDVHTLLRLPTGIFYKPGVKANVLFFDRKPTRDKAWTENIWIYDLRTNKHFTLRKNPLTRADLDEFVTCYKPGNRSGRLPTWSEHNPDGRWRVYSYQDILERDKINLDICWLRDESLEDMENLPKPAEIVAEVIEDLEAILAQFRLMAEDLTVT